MRAADIERLFAVSRPTLHPGGTRAVVAVSRPDLDADKTVGQLWSVPLDGTAPRRLTRGALDTAPAFSPDGAALAFLRSTPEGAQLHVMPAGGGEPLPLTDRPLGVLDFAWSPDSHRIAYTARVPEQGRYGSVPGIVSTAEPARRIARLDYKSNGVGYTLDRPAQVFAVTLPDLDAEPTYEAAPRPDGSVPEVTVVPLSERFTDDAYDYSRPGFVAGRVAAVAARHETSDRDLRRRLWVLEGTPEALTPDTGFAVTDFAAADDGALFVLAQDIGPDGVDFVGRNVALYRVQNGRMTPLTDAETIDLTESTITLHGTRVIVTNRARGRRVPLEVTGGAVRELVSGDVAVLGVAASAGAIVMSVADAESTGEVAVLRDGALVTLTDFGARARERALVAPEELEISGRDGYPVHGWVARPAGEGPHPTLLMIHGGPYADYGVALFDETQVYVDAGYAVVYCNPRGSAGYGQAHGRAIKERMGTDDLADVLDFLEGALHSYPQLDADRLGILGGSYGGYLTAWTIAHDHRFRAAIVERGFLDPEAFVGSADIGATFPQQYVGTDLSRIRAQSPQEVAGAVRTPTLVIHSEQDLRCPLAQAETYFATLSLNGVETELLLFPGENHELSRSGRPRHRIQRFEAILDWFGRHL